MLVDYIMLCLDVTSWKLCLATNLLLKISQTRSGSGKTTTPLPKKMSDAPTPALELGPPLSRTSSKN